MRRGVLIVILTSLVVAALALTISFLERQKEEIALSPDLAQDCSASEINALWDSVFKESSSGIRYVVNDSALFSGQNICPVLLAYKIKPNNETFVLAQYDSSIILSLFFEMFQNAANFSYNASELVIYAFHGVLNETLIQDIQNASASSPLEPILNLLSDEMAFANELNVTSGEAQIADETFFFHPLENLDSYIDKRQQPLDSLAALSTYLGFFEEYPDGAQWNFSSPSENLTFFYAWTFDYENITNETYLYVNASVAKSAAGANHSLEEYFRVDTTFELACESNWVAVNTTCSNGQIITWYNDTKGCPLGTPPPNETYSCDEQQQCQPNWEAVETECNANDIKIKWYNDTNNCGTTDGMPENETLYCDYNNNGIIGDASSINDVNLEVGIYIDGSPVDYSASYDGVHTVELREGNISRVEFDFDFSDKTLNLYQIGVMKQAPNAPVGILGVTGINEGKTLRVDKLNNRTHYVCVKDSANIVMTENCTSSSEKLVQCPGSLGQISCSVEGDLFVVSGLQHSIVKESTYALSPPVESCTPDWACTAWADCVDGVKRRVCIDVNGCGIIENKPLEEEPCECVPDWQCDPWLPVECPASGNQTRRCWDNNNCGVQEGKPAEVQQCEYTGNRTLYIILALIAFVASGIGVIIVLELWVKENEKAQAAQGKVIHTPSGKEMFGENKDAVSHSFTS